MTPIEAKRKWCPKAICSSQGFGTYNRLSDGKAPTDARCLADDCAIWQWSRARETKTYLAAVQARMKETGENFNIATNKVYAELGSTFEEVEGYCGLAGKDGAP